MKLFLYFSCCNAIAIKRYESFLSFVISESMPGSIHSRSSIEFYKQINAPKRVINILENGYKLPFLKEKVEKFWIPNNQSLFKNYNFAKAKLEEWKKDGYVIETFERPSRISV